MISHYRGSTVVSASPQPRSHVAQAHPPRSALSSASSALQACLVETLAKLPGPSITQAVDFPMPGGRMHLPDWQSQARAQTKHALGEGTNQTCPAY